MPELTYLEAIREGIWEEMERDDRVFMLGEDIGAYGGLSNFLPECWSVLVRAAL